MKPLLEVIEKIGPYAGLLAFIAVALLAMLYFSQARDVRRLRDWAGRAPERVAGVVQSFNPQTAELARPKRARIKMPGVFNDPRYVAVALGGVIVLGAGATYIVLQLGEGNESTASQQTKAAHVEKAKTIQPGQVTVAVLNGTGTPGLAASVGSSLRSAGFKVGNVTNASETGVAQTKVVYKKSAKAKARVVAKQLKLGASRVAVMSPADGSLAGSAKVAVIAGQDKTSQAPKQSAPVVTGTGQQSAPVTGQAPAGQVQ